MCIYLFLVPPDSVRNTHLEILVDLFSSLVSLFLRAILFSFCLLSFRPEMLSLELTRRRKGLLVQLRF